MAERIARVLNLLCVPTVFLITDIDIPLELNDYYWADNSDAVNEGTITLLSILVSTFPVKHYIIKQNCDTNVYTEKLYGEIVYDT